MVRQFYSTLLVILCLQACSLLSVAHHYWWLSTRAVEGWSNSTLQHFSVRAYRKQGYHDGRQVVRWIKRGASSIVKASLRDRQYTRSRFCLHASSAGNINNFTGSFNTTYAVNTWMHISKLLLHTIPLRNESNERKFPKRKGSKNSLPRRTQVGAVSV